MLVTSKTALARVIFSLSAVGLLGLSVNPRAWAARSDEEKPALLDQGDVKKAQQSLGEKGFYHGQADGVLGPQTRTAISEYQRSQNLPVTARLDAETAGKLGVGTESTGGNFKSAGQQVGEGGEQVGHQMKKGKPLAAGKEMGKSLGRAGKSVGKGIKNVFDPKSN